jgi:colicin import membrane protein
VSETENQEPAVTGDGTEAGPGESAAADEPWDDPSLADRCIWPGCTRPRAPGRTSGSGRQKEYCLQADPPEYGGGPVHNARNRWAALRAGGARPAPARGDDGADGTVPGLQAAGARPEGAGRGGPGAGHRNGGGEQSGASVRDPGPFTSAKKRAGELLEQARRQHTAALEGLRAEYDLYRRAGEELAALSDPAAVDLEIATMAARAGRQVAQAEQDAADARRAQLAAERDRDEAVRLRAAADDAAEQLAEDAAEAERLLDERTAAFERDLADFAARARTAEAAERAARDEATAVKAAAQAEAAAARDRAEQVAAALTDALRAAEQAREEAGREIGRARDQAAAAVAAAEERARQEAAAAQARFDDLLSHARAGAERDRETARQARDEAAKSRAEAEAAREAGRAAQAGAATAAARAAAAEGELARLRAELGRRDTAHAGELARLEAAHQSALDAERALLSGERARAERAETELDVARTAAKRP